MGKCTVVALYCTVWLNDNFDLLNIVASSLRSLGMQSDTDEQIYKEAKSAGAIRMSKDYDFIKLIQNFGVPPQLIWITCGNSSNAAMCEILSRTFAQAINLLRQNEEIVEITG